MIDLSDGGRRRPTPGDVILTVDDLEVYYGAAVALKGIGFEVRQGEVVVIIGANGAGKTTTMRTISGVSEPLQSTRGHISFRGRDISKLPAHKVQRLGVSHVPEGRHIFGESSVEDNLLLGAIRRARTDRSGINADLARIYDRFPVLGERRNRPAGLLSGGEQQMLAISRALMSRPDVVLLDEPSLGLAPIMIKAVFDLIEELAQEGTTILLVEQMANQALAIADRAYVLETGAITLEGTGAALLEDERVKAAYLGA
ncbi:MAG: ABC transporter ATP-binding protein [Acidimicrobiia bacterium]